MRKVAKDSFIGYSYQNLIGFLFFLFFESSKDGLNFELEYINNKSDNFDDIKLSFFNDIYVVQVKNYKESKIEIMNGEVKVGHSSSKLSNENTNVFVVSKPFDFEKNSNLFGFDCFFDMENNLYILSITEEEFYSYLANKFNSDKRIMSLWYFYTSKIVFKKDLVVNKSDIPEYYYYPTTLNEETFNIRKDFNFGKGFKFIYGKPGVGKSHLLSEKSIDNNRLYRFWIGDSDNDYTDRLVYSNFIMELQSKLFCDNFFHSEDEIISKLTTLDDPFFIDGLDHVENYHSIDLPKYEKFINELAKYNANVIILSRPLKADKFICKKENLDGWTFDEVKEYCECMKINDYTIQNKIYNIGKGYPIITSFLCKHYLEHGQIPLETPIENIYEYYDKLLNNRPVSFLNMFAICKSFITYDEVEKLTNNFIDINNLIKEYPYLFSRYGNRIYLIHDSLHLYIKNKCDKENDCPFVDNETPYGRAKQGHPVIVDYFYHEEVRGTNNTGKRNKN